MTTRRGARPTHVRPRPPSTGRPAPTKVRPRAPAPGRLTVHRPIGRGRGLPLVARLGLLAAVAALGVGVLYVGAGGLSTVVGGLGDSVGGFVAGVTATPTPRATVIPVSHAPALVTPAEPYVNVPTVDLQVTTPSDVVADPDHRIRVYLALKDQPAAPIQEIPVGATATTIIPVELTKGTNDFSVTIVGPGGESESSAVARYILDQTAPKITLTSPKDGGVVNRKAVSIKGKTQGRTTLLARNEANGASIAGSSAGDGTFELSLPLAGGANKISIHMVDPAGNEGDFTFTVRRGTGKLTVALSASAYRILVSKLPETIRLSATATDPDGRALKDADITFTLSIPGIPVVTAEGKTGSNGRAIFETRIPKGADPGQGNATVIISSDEFGSTEDYTVITLIK